MELFGQSILIMLLVASSIMAALTGRRLRNFHDVLLSVCAVAMMLRSIALYPDIDTVGPLYRTWLPLLVAVLLFSSVSWRHAEADSMCRAISGGDEGR